MQLITITEGALFLVCRGVAAQMAGSSSSPASWLRRNNGRKHKSGSAIIPRNCARRDRMRRREFLALVGGVAAWALPTRAQQTIVRRVAILMATAGDQNSPLVAVVREALRELGWNEGRNIQFEYRWAHADIERMQVFARELIALQPDLIIASSTQVVLALQRETRTIPIVFREVVDPVVTGLVPSLSHPGGNSTGFTNYEPSIMGKYVEFLKEIAPQIVSVAFLNNPQTRTSVPEPFTRASEAAASALGLKVIRKIVHDAADLDAAVAAISQEPGCGVVVAPSSFFNVHQARVIGLMAQHRLPAVYGFRFYAEGGGLLSYSVDQVQISKQVASYADRILRGEKPGDLPVVQPTTFELIINLKTARELGLVIPPGDPGRLPALIDELISLKPDVLAGSDSAVRVMLSKTSTIPSAVRSPRSQQPSDPCKRLSSRHMRACDARRGCSHGQIRQAGQASGSLFACFHG